MKLVIIGITDQPHPFFPPDIMTIVRSGEIFSGGKRHHELVRSLLPPQSSWIDITVPVEAVVEHYRQVDRPIIVFASGDPLFFGFANTLQRLLPEAELQVFPAFNSLQMLAHRLLLPYHQLRIASLTGRPWPDFDRLLIQGALQIGVLTDRHHTPAAIARRMLDYGYSHYTMHIGEHLGNPEQERVTTLTLNQAATTAFTLPNCVILSADANHSAPYPFGIPDSAFSTLDGRAKMITKMPIRLLTLQSLDLQNSHVLWDIGACTGSVSIEARLLFPHLHIEAFEIRPECEDIIRHNARRLGAPGIQLHIGDFLAIPEETLLGLPQPDAVFIGGHGGRLHEIMAKVVGVLTPGGSIVMNSVKAPRVLRDSHQLWDETCHDLALKQHPTTRIVLNDYHPIEILKASTASTH